MSSKHASLLRRAAPALAVTGVAGAFLALLDRPAPSGSPTEAAASTGSASASGSSATSDRSTGAATGSPTTTSPSSSCTGRAVDGSSVSTKYGTVQVSATVSSDGTLCDITVKKAPSGGKSGSITSRSVPVLRQRALSAQDAKFDGVSGATYTSQAYKKSLQAILDAT